MAGQVGGASMGCVKIAQVEDFGGPVDEIRFFARAVDGGDRPMRAHDGQGHGGEAGAAAYVEHFEIAFCGKKIGGQQGQGVGIMFYGGFFGVGNAGQIKSAVGIDHQAEVPEHLVGSVGGNFQAECLAGVFQSFQKKLMLVGITGVRMRHVSIIDGS